MHRKKASGLGLPAPVTVPHHVVVTVLYFVKIGKRKDGLLLCLITSNAVLERPEGYVS